MDYTLVYAMFVYGEGPTKELFSKPPDKIKSGTRGDQSSGEGGSAEPEGSEEGRKKR